MARHFEVEVTISLAIDGDEEAAFCQVDTIMQTAWETAHPHGLDATWHFTMPEGCVTDVTAETVRDNPDMRRCLDAGEHLKGQRHRWQECPTYHDEVR